MHTRRRPILRLTSGLLLLLVPRNASSAWVSVASNAYGNVLVGGTLFSDVWTSTDGGATFAQANASFGYNNQLWAFPHVSLDGVRLAVASFDSIVASNNSGQAWAALRHPWSAMHIAVFAASSDGLTLLAGLEDNSVYTSADAGASWSQSSPVPEAWRNAFAAACSSTGARMYLSHVGQDSVCRLSTSADGGATWKTAPTMSCWTSLGVSANGSIVVGVQAKYTNFGISTDYGESFTASSPNTSVTWTTVAVSRDGHIIVGSLASQGAPLYISADAGRTWSKRVPDSTVEGWLGIATSVDGRALAAVAETGMYISKDSGGTWDGPIGVPATPAPSPDPTPDPPPPGPSGGGSSPFTTTALFGIAAGVFFASCCFVCIVRSVRRYRRVVISNDNAPVAYLIDGDAAAAGSPQYYVTMPAGQQQQQQQHLPVATYADYHRPTYAQAGAAAARRGVGTDDPYATLLQASRGGNGDIDGEDPRQRRASTTG